MNNSSNNLPQFVCRFSLTHIFANNEWQDVTHEALEITWYANLVYQKDGTPTINQVNVDTIKEVFGWSGEHFSALADGDWSAVECQVVVEPETYNNKTTVKVRYVNPKDWDGAGLKKSDPQEIRSLDSQYGALLRAVGRTNGNGKPSSKPPTRPTAAPESPKRAAWKLFQELNKGKTADELAEMWKAEITSQFPTKDKNALTDADWVTAAKRMREPKVAVENPLPDEGEIDIDSIPF